MLTLLLARKWYANINVNVSCCLKAANGLSNMARYPLGFSQSIVSSVAGQSGSGEKTISCQIPNIYTTYSQDGSSGTLCLRKQFPNPSDGVRQDGGSVNTDRLGKWWNTVICDSEKMYKEEKVGVPMALWSPCFQRQCSLLLCNSRGIVNSSLIKHTHTHTHTCTTMHTHSFFMETFQVKHNDQSLWFWLGLGIWCELHGSMLDGNQCNVLTRTAVLTCAHTHTHTHTHTHSHWLF